MLMNYERSKHFFGGRYYLIDPIKKVYYTKNGKWSTNRCLRMKFDTLKQAESMMRKVGGAVSFR